MIKFTEVVVTIILVLLIYQTFKNEQFAQTFSGALASKRFNFQNDAMGYSQADKYLASVIHK
jgi:hypothetical protein